MTTLAVTGQWTKRQLIDGIRWRVRVGAPWRDVPERYGSWRAVYGLFRRWQRGGIWARVVSGLQARADAAGLICWDVGVDSTICTPPAPAGGVQSRRSRRAEWSQSSPITRWGVRGAAGAGAGR